MTRWWSIWKICIACTCLVSLASVRSAQAQLGATIETDGPVAAFYEALAPYGEWFPTVEYGWVWVPSSDVVGADFVPYASAGQWLETDRGWFFESDFDWGWAPFHYGRWYFDAGRGWIWVPGDVWAPSWVDWRVGGSYIGWSPLPPAALPIDRRRTHWVFARNSDFLRPRIDLHLMRRERARQAYVNSKRVRRLGNVAGLRGLRGNRGRRHHPIAIVPPRHGVVSRVRIKQGKAAVRAMPRQGRKRPPWAGRGPVQTQPVYRRGPARVQRPRHVIRGPVRARPQRRQQQQRQRQQSPRQRPQQRQRQQSPRQRPQQRERQQSPRQRSPRRQPGS